MMFSEMHEKCPVIFMCPPGAGIEVASVMWGQVRQMVHLQGKVPGWCGGLFEGRLLWTNRSLRFFARL